MNNAKNRFASLLALVLAVAMLLTMVGCGKDTGSGDDTTKTTTTTTTAAEGGESTTTAGDESTTTAGDESTTEGDESTTEAGESTTEAGESTTKAEDKKTTAKKDTTTKKDYFSDNTTKKTTAGKTTKKTTTTSKTLPKGDKNVLNQVPSKLKGTDITMMIWWNTAKDDKKEAENFKKETGITVKYETSVMAEYQSTLGTKVLAGDAPALAAIINEWYPKPITRGFMQPIKNTGWDFSDKNVYAHSMMDQFSYKGEHYGIALKGSNMTTFEVMFFNKDMLKQKGVKEDPYQLWKKGNWNWQTCLDIAKKCGTEKGMTMIYMNYWMLSAGQDFVISDKSGLKNNLSNPKLLEAWRFGWDILNTHKVMPKKFETQQNLFFNGEVAMMGAGSYFMQADSSHKNYVPQNCKFDWGVVPFPSPKGQNPVAACEGTVWGFPENVEGNELQAAAWYLRYYLDDATYSARDFYPSEECWEVMGWMWNQKIQSFNSVGVITYGGKNSAATVQYTLIDEAATKADIKSNLDEWNSVFDNNIDEINSEMD